VAFILLPALAAGALAAGSYELVRSSRLDESQSRSKEQLERAVQAVELRPTVGRLPETIGDFDTTSSEVVALAGGSLRGSITHTRDQIPPDLQELVGRQDEAAAERVSLGGTPYLVMGARVPGHAIQLYVFASEKSLFDDLGELGRTLLAGWLAIVALAALIGWILARRTLAPVARASDAARSLAEGLLETRLPEGGDDEFGAWAASFNEMAEALESKIAALQEAGERERRFTSDVSHELRTPLTALVSEASVLREHLDQMPPEARRPAEMVVHDVARLRRLVEDLMEISRLDSGGGALQLEPVDLSSLIEAVIRARGWDGRVETALASTPLQTDRRRLERIVSNLVGNALEHGGRGVHVRAGRDPQGAFVEVSDRGAGIKPEDLPHLFDRFYKADPSRSSRGSGLGLAIAMENARLLGGDIDVWSEAGSGTRFTLRLPVTQPLPQGEGGVSSAPHDEAIRGERGGPP
jgi:signal transduction histidine kinase